MTPAASNVATSRNARAAPWATGQGQQRTGALAEPHLQVDHRVEAEVGSASWWAGSTER